MRRRLEPYLRAGVCLLLLVGSIPLLNGCETLERTIKDSPNTAAGAGAGGAGGAVIGGLAGGGTGALVGGLSGVLAGGVIGNLLDRQERTRESTAETTAYTVEKGNLVRIEEVSLNPQVMRPGETLNVSVHYAIVTPSGRDPIRVREVRQIYHQGELVGNPMVEVERLDGTYWSTLPIKLPASAPLGRYDVVVGVDVNGTLDRWETRFTVVE